MKRLRRVSRSLPARPKWMKKNWVVKRIKNPPVMVMMGMYPPVICPKCGFFPCYADAYGTYRCPRCGKTFTVGGTTLAKSVVRASHPPATCYLKEDVYHPYYPVYWNAIDGCYRCPRCRGTFQ